MTNQHAEAVVSRSPHDPGSVVATADVVSAEGVGLAYGASVQAQRGWAAGPALQRAEALNVVADSLAAEEGELTRLVVTEVGKPVTEARAEVARAVATIRYFAQQALASNGESYPGNGGSHSAVATRRSPLGVVGLITPWNFPVLIPAWKLAPAVAFGNGVLWKPSPEALGCAQLVADTFRRALPDGLVAMLPGDVETGTALIQRVDGVSFTGSVPVGRIIISQTAERLIPVQAELGGLNASIVMPDADVDVAARTIIGAAMGYAGQKCTATSRIIVVGRNQPFLDALAAATESLVVGDPAAASTVVGPVITERARDNVCDAVERATGEGGRILASAPVPDGATGWFAPATVIADVQPHHSLAQEEVFGPVAAVLNVADEAEAYSVANGTRYGLSTAVFTRDLDVMMRASDLLDVGLLRFNAPTSGADFHAPFGGARHSSYGPQEQGTAARDFYTKSRTISYFSTTS